VVWGGSGIVCVSGSGGRVWNLGIEMVVVFACAVRKDVRDTCEFFGSALEEVGYIFESF
jgi:hypothetical protein